MLDVGQSTKFPLLCSSRFDIDNSLSLIHFKHTMMSYVIDWASNNQLLMMHYPCYVTEMIAGVDSVVDSLQLLSQRLFKLKRHHLTLFKQHL